MLIPMETRRLDCAPAKRGEPMELHFGDGQVARARTLVIATGARYRRPAECSNLMALEGRGVWYWASPIEAKMCAGQEVVLVGGGNSAGQAAVYLSGHASKVWMLVRGPGLAASMSKYLIDRIAGTPNLELLTRTEITGLSGSRQSGVETVTWTNRNSGERQSRPIRARRLCDRRRARRIGQARGRRHRRGRGGGLADPHLPRRQVSARETLVPLFRFGARARPSGLPAHFRPAFGEFAPGFPGIGGDSQQHQREQDPEQDGRHHAPPGYAIARLRTPRSD